MNMPLEKLILKYVKEYRKQLCNKCSNKCILTKKQRNCLLMNINEKNMIRYIATRLTVLE